ncbi:glycosyltransferase family 2 protein [Bacteroides fluxus]|uniref:glycosyltransferase family 2 protein n=1 Tax=Bacteroides fluxus TaxID=626930 RepID=UPI0023A85E06|nr:glycosyltransferase family A protein [Bacteroides fluxus]
MLVTVGIPFYNSARFLKNAIQSVINQTYTDWKLILIDDGSTDTSLSVASSFIDSRIEIISDGQNRGLIYRLNQLIEICDTKYLARMDADDIMHPQRLEKQLLFLEGNPHVDIVGSWAYSIDIYNQIHGILEYKNNPHAIMDVFRHQCFIHPSIVGRKKWFDENLYDSNYVRVEDMELWCRTINKSHFCNISEPLLFYREIGVPYLSKYLLSMRGVRKLIKVYNKSNKLRMCAMLLVNYLKSSVYIVAFCLKLQNVLIRRRSYSVPCNIQLTAMNSLSDAIK